MGTCFKEASKAWKALPPSLKADFAAKAAASKAAFKEDPRRLLKELAKQVVSFVLFPRIQNIFNIGWHSIAYCFASVATDFICCMGYSMERFIDL